MENTDSKQMEIKRRRIVKTLQIEEKSSFNKTCTTV